MLKSLSRSLLIASIALAAAASSALTVAAEDRAVVPKSSSLRLIDDQFELPDGAGWDGANKLYVPDVKAKTLKLFSFSKDAGAPKVVLNDIAISGCCFQLGKLYLSDNQGARIATYSQGQQPETLAQFDPQDRPNDLTVDALGNVYVTMTRQGEVRKILPDGTTSVLCGNLITPNGIALSPSGKTLYVSSAKSGKIYRIDLKSSDSASVDAVDFAQLPETDNGFRGDGMCTDRSGHLFVTAANAVHVFRPDGRSVAVIDTPHRPINAIIAGTSNRTLYVSTFGGLYAMELNRYGVSPNRSFSGEDTSPIATVVRDDIEARFNVVFHTDDDRELLMDLFSPKSENANRPAVVVVHGGGWKKGDKTKFRSLALRLAERGYCTAAIEYRLAGEATFPTAIRDCNAATAYLRRNARSLGIDSQQIFAVGGSAGGHLVGLMAAGSNLPSLRHPSDRASDVSLKAAVVMAGPLQIASGNVAEKSLTQRAQSNSVMWMDGSVEEKSELYHLADAYEKVDPSMAPTLFISGSLDNPERNQPTREAMTRIGIPNRLVVHPDARHGHWNRADWIEQVVKDIDIFLKEHMSHSKP